MTTYDSDVLLMNCVRDYKEIYDWSNPGYRNATRKAAAWNEVTKKLGIDLAVAKRRYSFIRNCFPGYVIGKEYQKWMSKRSRFGFLTQPNKNLEAIMWLKDYVKFSPGAFDFHDANEGCTYGETGSGTEDSEAHTDYSDDDENDCEALYTGAMSNSTACPKVTEGAVCNVQKENNPPAAVNSKAENNAPTAVNAKEDNSLPTGMKNKGENCQSATLNDNKENNAPTAMNVEEKNNVHTDVNVKENYTASAALNVNKENHAATVVSAKEVHPAPASATELDEAQRGRKRKPEEQAEVSPEQKREFVASEHS
ncbi:uncharacterized protein LOC135817907 [Sycon ciliatum]|uniref:uncharacterized protein LOC135817907 n=1 Tax=Sycon ciliatum TaxID=27933 RepID=UPI0031F6FDC8